MEPVTARLKRVRERIAQAEQRYHRPPGSVRLLAVSKAQPIEAMRAAMDADQDCFGESYVQEALPKINILAGAALEWHFIGAIQSNKTREVATHFDWAHSVDRLKIARRLSEQRPADRSPLNICLQVDVSGEPSKGGLSLAELPRTAAEVAGLARVRLRGLMAIPRWSRDFDAQRRSFRLLRESLESLRALGLELDTLSMGMSGDLEAAIAEGATIVRLGTAIFGERDAGRKPPSVPAP